MATEKKKTSSGWPADPTPSAFHSAETMPPSLDHAHLKFQVSPADLERTHDGCVLPAGKCIQIAAPAQEILNLKGNCVLVYLYEKQWDATCMPKMLARADAPTSWSQVLPLEMPSSVLIHLVRPILVPTFDSWVVWNEAFVTWSIKAANSRPEKGTAGDANT